MPVAAPRPQAVGRACAVSLACSLLSLPAFVGLWAYPVGRLVPGYLAFATAFAMQAAGLLVAAAILRRAAGRRGPLIAGAVALLAGVVVLSASVTFLLGFFVLPSLLH